MTKLARKISGVAVYVDGITYVGQAEFTPPNVAASVEESDMPGHGGAFDIPTGRLDKMDAELKVMDSVPALQTLVGNPKGAETEVLCVAVYTDGESDQRTESWSVRGTWREQNRDAVGASGDAGVENAYVVNVRVLTHKVDGTEVRHVDLVRDIHRINGTDVNAARRQALRGG